MQNLQQQVTQRLTRLYIIALTTVAVLCSVGQLLVQNSLRAALDDAHVVNIAGRQRMLSQRISKGAILVVNPPLVMLQTKREEYRQTLLKNLTLWQRSHEGLRDGTLQDSVKSYVVKNSPAIQAMFVKTDSVFQIVYQNALKIAQNQQDSLSLGFLLENEGLFLAQMEAIVGQYDTEAQERVRRVRNIEWLLYAITIVILVLEGLLIFRPLTRYVEAVIVKVVQSEAMLQLKNEELHRINLQLVTTQNDLSKTNVEKYELIRKEHQTRSSALIEGQEEERKRLSRDLHDGIGQMLTGLKLSSEKLKNLFENDSQRAKFADHQKLINETIEATRATAFALMPSALHDFGLSAAIRILAKQSSLGTDTQINYKEVGTVGRLAASVEINLYRIAQEALNNALKHAKTSQIDITLKIEKNKITLIVTDFGKGMDKKKISKTSLGNGLKNIETRTNILNGKLQVLSSPNEGTTIVVTIQQQPQLSLK
ncbi:MAG: type IV pili methyl-accepting chemotaxis transducer N-terminal domain-containing protein [Spirosomaceae bacterium]|jgi:signal transduction histidine kinase|nr:type IV pili methyl-accepting chemotaxis transducer N-terminal domain-containing protein [Spirosomataceae bacterium]